MECSSLRHLRAGTVSNALRVCLALAGAFLRVVLETPPAPALVRGPYLQRPDDRTVEILWRTSSILVGSVSYGRPGTVFRTASDAAAAQAHAARLSDLEAGKIYEYQVFGDGAPLSPVLSFRAPREAADDEIAFAVVGDTAGRTVPAQIASLLRFTSPDLLLHTGDVVYPDGRLDDYDPEFFGPMAALLATTPVMPILGDHDVKTADGAPFFSVFDLPDNGLTAQPRYYSFRQGDAEFFCLDVESSEYGEDSDQYRWLERSLAESTAVWKFVTVFEPPFTSENSNVVERLILSPLFERFGVDIVFSGHEHLYERSKPIRMFGASGKPVTYVVEGGGGASLSSFDPEDFSAFVAAVHGYVTVRVSNDVLRLEAHDAAGSIIDSVTMRKGADGSANDASPLAISEPPPAGVSAGRR